ncbi:MAG: DUF6702 family protein [Crocinitomicaceae bacterium]
MKKLLFIFAIFFCAPLMAHQYFISIAEMEYNSEKNRIDVSLKMTAHDLEDVIGRKFDEKIDIMAISDSSKVFVYFQDYLKHNFRVISEEEVLRMSYLGKEIKNTEDLFVYFSFLQPKNPAAIKIISNLLYSISDLQQNIVHYKYLNQTKSVTLVASENQAEITFE